MRKRKIIIPAVAIAGVALAACSSSTSTTSGTEHFSGVAHGQAALGNIVQLTFTGPVDTTGTFNTSGTGPKPGQLAPFLTKAGTLMLKVDKVPVNTQNGNPTTCVFTANTVVDYSVVGSKSTGKFKDATGSGKVTVVFSGTGPRLSNGKCNLSSSAQPIASTAYSSFVGAGPLSVTS